MIVFVLVGVGFDSLASLACWCSPFQGILSSFLAGIALSPPGAKPLALKTKQKKKTDEAQKAETVLSAVSYIYIYIYLTVILRGGGRYELIYTYITNEAVGRVGYYQLISGKSEKNNCFSKFSSNSLDFFG